MSSYSGGYDGNSSSKGAENKPSFEAASRLQLGSQSSLAAQARVLGLCLNPAGPDLSFKESSVKDVTDKARTSAASKLQKALEKMLVTSITSPACHIEGGVLKRKASAAFVDGISHTPASSSSSACAIKQETDMTPASSSSLACAPKHETDMRQEVREEVEKLKKIRLSGGAEVDSAVSILKDLALQPISASCLKITKIGVEINQGFWRGSQNNNIRELATTLVHKWRSLYRAENGAPEPVIAAASVSTTRCRTLSMILEQTCHTHVQKVKMYSEFVDDVIDRLLSDQSLARKIGRDSAFATEFVTLLAQQKKVRGKL